MAALQSHAPTSFVPRRDARLGRWRLQEQLGNGSFGSTWRAVDSAGREVAVKLLTAPPGDEARALARVCHPAVITVHDAGTTPAPYLVMDLAPGRPLDRLLGAGLPPEDRAIAIAAVLADALAAVHHAEVVHGDIKPENIVVERVATGQLALVDFGMAGSPQGGTLLWAAPERTGGAPATAASDVYSLGLILWRLLHDDLPWARTQLAASLMQRRREAPVPTHGARWLRELLHRMLAVRPEDRPTAADVAATMEDHGARLPPVTSDLLRRRSRTVHVAQPELERAVHRWLADGGQLALLGPNGSGRSHHLHRLVTELQARGLPCVRLEPGASAWASVEDALRDPSLPGEPRPLPSARSPEERARLAAAELVDRAAGSFAVTCDDHERLDAGGNLVLAELSRMGQVRVAVAGAVAPAWCPDALPLEPLDREKVGALLDQVLGDVADRGRLEAWVLEHGHGMPGRIVDLVTRAVDQGALVRRAYRWLLDESRLPEPAAERAPPIEHLPAEVRELGALLAVHGGTVPLAELPRLAGRAPATTRRMVEGLADAGLVRVEAGRTRVAGPAAAQALRDRSSDLSRHHRALLQSTLAERPVPWLRVARHLAGAGDHDLAVEHGPPAVEVMLAADPKAAARLADALWSRWPEPALAGARLDALVAAGKTAEALAFGQAIVAGREPERRDLPVLLSLAHVYTHHLGDEDAAWTYLVQAWTALGDAPPSPRLLIVTANVHFRADRLDEAIAVARRLADAPPPRDSEQLDAWLALRGTWAQALHRKGDLAGAITILESVPTELGAGRPARAILTASHGRLLWHAGRMREAAQALTAASHSDAGLPALERARLLNNAALASYQVGDLNGALNAWEQALLLAERMGVMLEQVRIQNNLCIGYREARRWERARQAGEWAVGRAERLDAVEYQAMAAGNLGDLHLAREDFDEARRWFEQARELATQHDLRTELVELLRREAELAVIQNAPDALERCRLARDGAAQAQASQEEARATALEATCQARRGDHEATARLVQRAEAHLRDAGATRDLAEVRMWAGVAWSALGRNDEAHDALSSAVAYATECGHALLRHRAQEQLDRLLGAAGPPVQDGRVLELLRLSARLTSQDDPKQILEAIADAALDLLDAERAFVLVGADAEATGAERRRPEAKEGPPSRTIIERALRARREVIAVDIDERADLRAARSVVQLGVRMAMCVPLLQGDELLGVIYVDSRTASERELSSATELMNALADNAAAAVSTSTRVRRAQAHAAMAAELAHDLRNPAAAIMAIAQRQRRASQDGAWEDVEQLTQRILAMVGHWLEPHRAGRQRVDLTALVERVVASQAHAATDGQVQIGIAAAPGAWAQADPVELERALVNLLHNALKYAPAQTAVEVCLEQAESTWTFSVRDRGPGIPPEAQAAIFARGVQGPGAVEGFGLGLAIARRVLTEHGGGLSAGNHPDGGAVFQAWLPAA